MKKKTIAVICGGPSSEHEVSCVSAGGVLQGLDREKFNPILIGITKKGEWIHLPLDQPLLIVDGRMPTVELNGSEVTVTAHGFIIDGEFVSVDCVFPVLHGEFGEDGQVQKILDDAAMKYVGSGMSASAQAMDKSMAKSIFAAHNMSVADGVVVEKVNWQNQLSTIKYPVFVKPSSGGSSRGTHKVTGQDLIAVAIQDALLYDSKVLIEQAIVGREIECAVLERNGDVIASVVGEIVVNPKFDFYDFEAKYLDDATTVKIPADIPTESAEEIRSLAIEAFNALGCKGLARCDFFYTTSGTIIINEINTMPGFTGTSVYPKLWQASGIDYTTLISTLIESALK